MSLYDNMRSNLARSDKALAKAREHRHVLLREYAELCMQKIRAGKVTLSLSALLSDIRLEVEERKALIAKRERTKEEDLSNPLLYELLWDFAMLSRLLAENLRQAPSIHYPWCRPRPEGNTVCYVKTLQSEKAFSLFSAHCENAALFYVSNSEEGFSAVDGKRADFCLVPYETAEGVRIIQTERLAEKHDLHIVSLFSVADSKSGESVLFALYAKDAHPFLQKEPLWAELTLAGGEELPLFAGSLLSLFPCFEARVARFSLA